MCPWLPFTYHSNSSRYSFPRGNFTIKLRGTHQLFLAFLLGFSRLDSFFIRNSKRNLFSPADVRPSLCLTAPCKRWTWGRGEKQNNTSQCQTYPRYWLWVAGWGSALRTYKRCWSRTQEMRSGILDQPRLLVLPPGWCHSPTGWAVRAGSCHTQPSTFFAGMVSSAPQSREVA